MDAKLRAIREALVHHHIEVEQQGLVEEVIETFARPRYDIVATNGVFDGADRVRERIRALAAAMPGCKIEVTHVHHADDAVIVETRTQGIHQGVLLGIAPTGRAYDIRGVAIFRFEGDKLVEEAVYYDRQTILEQIRPTTCQSNAESR